VDSQPQYRPAASTLVLAVGARIYREGLAAALCLRPGMVVAIEADGAGAIAAMERCQAEVVLVDVTLAGGLELVSLASKRAPPTKVIALAVRSDDGDRELLQWAEAGAAGFVTSNNSITELNTCIDSVLRGELACSPRVSASLLRRIAELAAERAPAKEPPLLTPRQACVLDLVRRGQTNKQIARELGIELATVKNHVHHLLQRLQVSHRSEAGAGVASAAQPQPGKRQGA
jgi:DNA-binding NarL/FixJ family response regulator